jgi:hypothetical protein
MTINEVFPRAVIVHTNALDRRGRDAVSAATESCESSVELELEADFAMKYQRHVGTLWLRHCLLEVLDPALSLAMLVVADAVEVEVDVQGVEWSRL